MRKIKRLILVSCILIPSWFSGVGQDIHFFHFEGSGPLLSPAEAGSGNGKYRFSVGHRSQWASVTAPFLSNHFSLDAYIKPAGWNTKIGWGLSLQQDQAGDADFGTTGGMLSLNAMIAVAKDQNISIGMGAGFMQRKFDRNKLYYDEQFNGTTFDPGISPLDVPGDGPVSYLDLSAGVAWNRQLDLTRYYKVGFAVHHPNTPSLSFMEDNEIRLDARWTTYFMSSFPLRREFALKPAVRLMKQGSYYEYLLGSWLSYQVTSAFPERVNVEAGLFTRMGDALIVALGGHYGGWRAAMSYEVNYSGLRPASSWRGGWELNLVYELSRLAPVIERKPGCFLL